MYSLSLKLIGSNNVGNGNHLVLIDWVKILRDVLQSDTHTESTVRITHT